MSVPIYGSLRTVWHGNAGSDSDPHDLVAAMYIPWKALGQRFQQLWKHEVTSKQA